MRLITTLCFCWCLSTSFWFRFLIFTTTKQQHNTHIDEFILIKSCSNSLFCFVSLKFILLVKCVHFICTEKREKKRETLYQKFKPNFNLSCRKHVFFLLWHAFGDFFLFFFLLSSQIKKLNQNKTNLEWIIKQLSLYEKTNLKPKKLNHEVFNWKSLNANLFQIKSSKKMSRATIICWTRR